MNDDEQEERFRRIEDRLGHAERDVREAKHELDRHIELIKDVKDLVRLMGERVGLIRKGPS